MPAPAPGSRASRQRVWRFPRAQKIDLAGRKSWCESNDPAFVAKAADVVGLYMAPPQNAIVICVAHAASRRRRTSTSCARPTSIVCGVRAPCHGLRQAAP